MKRLFYGWYIVIAGLLLYAYNTAIFGYGITAFINPIIATFGWSYTQLSLAKSLRSLESGAFNPLFGSLVDRWSSKWLMLTGIIVTGLGVFLLARTTNLLMYYAGFLIMGLGSSLAVSMIPMTVMARWFRRDLGKASAIYNVGGGIGGIFLPVLVIIIDRFGWQQTFLFSAIGFLLLGIPLSFLFRDRPEDYGQLPDGNIATNVPGSVTPSSALSVGVKEALKTRAFWYLSIALLFQQAVLGLFSLYILPYLTSRGMTREAASMVMLIYSIIALASRIPLGMLTDVFNRKYLMAASIALMAVGLLLFSFIGGDSPFWLTLLFAVIFSVGMSESLIVRPVIQGEYFGTKSFGRIFGITGIFSTAGGLVAPVVAGWVVDTYHVYQSIWLTMVGLGIVTAVLVLTIRPIRDVMKSATE